MPRVFIALPLPERVASAMVSEISSHLSLEQYPAENLHITVWFIGDVADAHLAAVAGIAQDIASHSQPFTCTTQQLFLADRRLRLAVVSPALAAMQAAFRRAFGAARLGKYDARPYRPHVTVGRVQQFFDLARLPTPTSMEFMVPAVGLYLSEPGARRLGSYTLLQNFPLGGEKKSALAEASLSRPAPQEPSG